MLVPLVFVVPFLIHVSDNGIWSGRSFSTPLYDQFEFVRMRIVTSTQPLFLPRHSLLAPWNNILNINCCPLLFLLCPLCNFLSFPNLMTSFYWFLKSSTWFLFIFYGHSGILCYFMDYIVILFRQANLYYFSFLFEKLVFAILASFLKFFIV